MSACGISSFRYPRRSGNSSGAVVAVLTFATVGIGDDLPPWRFVAVALVCLGVFFLGLTEANEDPELRRARQDESNRHYAKSWIAILLPVIYCLLDALGTFADSRVLEVLDEDSANVAYELTFLAAGIASAVYTPRHKEAEAHFRQEALKYTGAIFERPSASSSISTPLPTPSTSPCCAHHLLVLRGLGHMEPHLPSKESFAQAPSVDSARRRGIVILGNTRHLNKEKSYELFAYKRVVVKISGEALAGDKKTGFDFDFISHVCSVIKGCIDDGAQVGIVIGGGNFWRGVKDGAGKVERVSADRMGMLATCMNCLAVCDVFRQLGAKARVMTAVDIQGVGERYDTRKAIEYMEDGNIVLFAGGSGAPFFSTDTAAVLRAAEIHADGILLAKTSTASTIPTRARILTRRSSTASAMTRSSPVTSRSWTPPPRALRWITPSPSSSLHSRSPRTSAAPLSGEALGTTVG